MIIHGDCLQELEKLEAESIDFVCTDPPYGYSFMGKEWDKAVPSVEVWRECLRVLKPGAFMCVMSAPRSDVQCAMISRLMEAGFRVDFTPIYWTFSQGFPKAADTEKLAAKRGIEAPQLRGSKLGFQPKPAVEVIIVAMKSLSEKTLVDQALSNGKGISWLDDGRIPTTSSDNFGKAVDDYGDKAGGQWHQGKQIRSVPPEDGRFPANLLVSDDVLNDGQNSSRKGKPYQYAGRTYNVSGFIQINRPQAPSNYADGGSYSRYFDLDKWWDAQGLPLNIQRTLPFMAVPKASKSEKDKGLEDLYLLCEDTPKEVVEEIRRLLAV